MNSAHQRIAMPDGGKRKAAAACAIAGSVLLIAGTYFHPVPADPNDAVMAFTEYAADRLWIASHLAQLTGIVLILTTLILIADLQQAVSSGFCYRIAAAGAIACIAVAAALQAIDGIALKRAVNAWSAAPIMKRDAAFYAALAIRQAEVGLASTLSLLLGVTATLYGLAMLGDEAFPNWVAVLAMLGGAATAVAGVVMAYTGFSAMEMYISMPANYILVLWMLIIGVLMWRAGGRWTTPKV